MAVPATGSAGTQPDSLLLLPAPFPPVARGWSAIPLSGLALVLFLIAHLAALTVALVDPAGFEAWAALLHRQPWLPAFELLLAAALLVHPLLALVRSLANRLARGQAAAPLRSRRGGGLEGAAALAARSLPWSGALLLLFLVVHLLQLRLPRPAVGAELAAVRQVLGQPASLVLYVLAGLAVGLHLLHGHESAHRSLGWLDPANGARIRGVGRALALLLGGCFTLLPLALALAARLPGGLP
jgi:succinate dehydrogenase / fumarate reductase cytochrome b subunit